MKSGKTSRKEHFPFNLYQNPLKDRHRKFLEEKNYAGKNQPQTADEIEDKMEQATRMLFHTLANFQKLEKSKVYDVINAKSMHHLLDAAAQQYDFRTAELIRLLFEMSIIFLKNSPNLKNQKEIIEDMANPLSKFFQMLSESLLQDENLNMNISKEEREKIKEFLQKTDNKNNKMQYDLLKKRNDELYDEIYKQDIHQRIISKHVKITSHLDPLLITSRDISEIIEQIRNNNERLAQIHGDSAIREGQIWRLSNAYNHLEPYACRIKPLKEFSYLLNRTLFESSYIHDLNREINNQKLEIKFEDQICEEYLDKDPDRSNEGVFVRYSKTKQMIFIPKDVHDREKRKFFAKYDIELDDSLNPQEKEDSSNLFDVYKYKPKWSIDDKSYLLP